jgi:hypothetical protein
MEVGSIFRGAGGCAKSTCIAVLLTNSLEILGGGGINHKCKM